MISFVILSLLPLQSQVFVEIFNLVDGLFPSFLLEFIDVVHNLDHPIQILLLMQVEDDVIVVLFL